MRRLLFLGLIGAAVTAAPIDGPTTFPFPSPQISHSIPKDAQIPAGFSKGTLPLQYFDDYSWRMFLALNWDASSTRGAADTTRLLPTNAGLRVWESWKAMYEIFPDTAGETPDPDWADVTPLDAFCAAGSGRRIAMSGNATDLNQAGAATHAGMGPLIDRDARYVQYEIRVNRSEFLSLLSAELYLGAKVDALENDPSSGMSFAPGAIEVKAAWKEIGRPDESLNPAAADRYFQTTAMVLDPSSNKCVSRRMALIALHIVQKTPQRPQWVWSSFEHVDLLSAQGPLSVRADNPARLSVATAPKSPCTPKKQTSALAETQSPASVVTKAPWPVTPTRLARLRGISDCTEWTNNLYQSALISAAKTAGMPEPVWANYALVTTQWPNDAFNLSSGSPKGTAKSDAKPHLTNASTSVANVAVETYRQTGTSCMACHDKARGTDFVWFPHLRAFQITSGSLERSSARLSSIK